MSINVGEVEAILKLRDEMSPVLKQAAANAAPAMEAIKSQLKSAEQNVRDLEAAVKQYASIDPAKSPLPKMLDEAKKQAADLKVQLDGATKAVGAHEDAQKKAEAATRKSITAQRELAVAMKGVGDALTLSVTAPIVAAGAASVHFAAQYETNINKVGILSDASAEEIKKMREEILKLAPAVGIGPAELAKGLYPIESAAYRGKDALEILTKSAKMSAMGLGEMEPLTRTLVGSLQSFRTMGLKASDAADIMMETIRKGNMPVESLAASLGRVNPVAAAVGVSFGQVGAAIATFTHEGISTAEAVTGLRAILMNLNAASKQSKDMWAQLGYTMADVRKEIDEKGLAKFLVDLIDKSGDNIDVLHKLIPNVRGLAEELAIARSNGKMYLQNAEDITHAHGVLEAGFKTTQQTMAQGWNQIKAQFEVLAIQVGNELLPKLKDLMPTVQRIIESVMSLVGWFGKLPGPVQTFLEIMLGVGAVGGPLLSGLGRVLDIWTKIRAAILAANVAAESGAAVGLLGRLMALGGGVLAAGGAGIAAGAAAPLALLKYGTAPGDLTANITQALGGNGINRGIGRPGDIQLPSDYGFTDSSSVSPEGRRPPLPGKLTAQQTSLATFLTLHGGEEAFRSMAALRGFDVNKILHPGSAKLQAAYIAQYKSLESQRPPLLYKEGENLAAFHKGLIGGPLGFIDAPAELIRHKGVALPPLWKEGENLSAFHKGLIQAPPTGAFGLTMNTLSGQIPGLVTSALTGGGGIGGALAAIGSAGGSSFMGNLFGKAGGASGLLGKGGALSGMTGLMGNMLGSAMPIIGSFIGPLAGKLFGALKGIGGPSKEEKEARTGQGDLIAQFRQSGAKGTDTEVLAGTVTTAMGDIGKSAAEANKLVADLMDTHHPQVFAAALKQVNEVLEKQKQKVLDVADGVASVTKAFNKAGNNIPQDIVASMEKLREMKGLTDAQKESIDGMIDAAHPKFKDLMGIADEFGISLSQLGPKLQQSDLEDKSKHIKDSFDILTRAGADANGVLAGMADEIQGLVSDSVKFGTAIPENMKPLIQSLIDQGKLVGENGDALRDMSGIKFEKTPLDVGIKNLVDSIQHLVDVLTNQVPGAVATAVGSIPQNPFADWIPPDPGSFEQRNHDNMATGGYVTSSGILHFGSGGMVPRGTDTVPAMLTPGEMVLTRAQQKAEFGGRASHENEVVMAIRRLQEELRHLPLAVQRGVRDGIVGAGN